MTADIKYTVKHHARDVKKVANVLFLFAGIIVLLLDFIWTPVRSLTPDLQALVIFYIIPQIFWDMHSIAFISAVLGFGLWLFRWRKGEIHLTEERLIVTGSYYVSIWLRNIWEVDVRKKCILKLDSNVDAVQIKFKTEKECIDFSDKLILLTEKVENIKIKTISTSI